MAFVPYVAPSSPPSPRAQELGRQLSEAIEKYCQENPDISGTEIRQAMALAQRGVGAGKQSVAIALVVGFLTLGVAGFYIINRQPDMADPPMLLMIVVIVAVIAVGIGFFLKNR